MGAGEYFLHWREPNASQMPADMPMIRILLRLVKCATPRHFCAKSSPRDCFQSNKINPKNIYFHQVYLELYKRKNLIDSFSFREFLPLHRYNLHIWSVWIRWRVSRTSSQAASESSGNFYARCQSTQAMIYNSKYNRRVFVSPRLLERKKQPKFIIYFRRLAQLGTSVSLSFCLGE